MKRNDTLDKDSWSVFMQHRLCELIAGMIVIIILHNTEIHAAIVRIDILQGETAATLVMTVIALIGAFSCGIALEIILNACRIKLKNEQTT